MKTAKSSTEKELAGKLLIDVAFARAHRWTEREFDQLRYKEDFVIHVPMTKRSWAVGKFDLTVLGDHRWHLTDRDRIDLVFYSRKAAVFYAYFTQRKNYKLADPLVRYDQDVAKYRDEVEFYSQKLAKQLKNKQVTFDTQLYQSRYLESRARYNSARKELEKTLNQTKYTKVWDQIL